MPGTYGESLVFPNKSITLRSVNPESEYYVSLTTIVGDAGEPTISFQNYTNEGLEEGPAPRVVDGFTIIHVGFPGEGIAWEADDWPRHCRPTIRNCVITENEAMIVGGGAIVCCDGLIESNQITENTTDVTDEELPLPGGGLLDCDGEIRGNTITNNTTDAGGGGLWGCDGIIADNRIQDNTAGYWGGGIYNSSAQSVIERNVILENEVTGTYTGTQYGGGLGLCHGIMQNNVIRGNLVNGSQAYGHYGGGLGLCYGNIRNNTIYGNSTSEANSTGGGIGECNGAALITNNILWGNKVNDSDSPVTAQICASSNTPDYSCIQWWQSGGTGNFADNPLLDLAPDGVCRLQALSPCIDRALPSQSPGNDYEGDTRDFDEDPAVSTDGANFDVGADELVRKVEFQVVESRVSEACGTAKLIVTLTPPLRSGASPISVPYSIGLGEEDSGLAQTEDINSSTSGNITFSAGDASKTVDIEIVDDTAHENYEKAVVSLSAATGNPSPARLGEKSVHALTISDNDFSWRIRPENELGVGISGAEWGERIMMLRGDFEVADGEGKIWHPMAHDVNHVHQEMGTTMQGISIDYRCDEEGVDLPQTGYTPPDSVYPHTGTTMLHAGVGYLFADSRRSTHDTPEMGNEGFIYSRTDAGQYNVLADNPSPFAIVNEKDGDLFMTVDARIMDYATDPEASCPMADGYPYSRMGGDIMVCHPNDLGGIFHKYIYTDFDVFNLDDALSRARPPWLQYAGRDTDTMQYRVSPLRFQPRGSNWDDREYDQPDPYAPSHWRHYSFNLTKAVLAAWKDKVPDVAAYEFGWGGAGLEYYQKVLAEMECDNIYFSRGHPVYTDFAHSARTDQTTHIFGTQSYGGGFVSVIDEGDAFDGDDDTDSQYQLWGPDDINGIIEITLDSRDAVPETPVVTPAPQWVNALRLKTTNPCLIREAFLYDVDASEQIPILRISDNSTVSGDPERVFYFSPVETSHLRLHVTDADLHEVYTGLPEPLDWVYFLRMNCIEVFYHEDVDTLLGNVARQAAGAIAKSLDGSQTYPNANDGDPDTYQAFDAAAQGDSGTWRVIRVDLGAGDGCLRRVNKIVLRSPNHSLHNVAVYCNDFREGAAAWGAPVAMNQNPNVDGELTLYFSSMVTDKVGVVVTDSGGDPVQIGEVELYREGYSVNPPISCFAIYTDKNYGQPDDSLPTDNRVSVQAFQNSSPIQPSYRTLNDLVTDYDPEIEPKHHNYCKFGVTVSSSSYLDIDLNLGLAREVGFVSFSTQVRQNPEPGSPPVPDGVPTQYEIILWDEATANWEATPVVSCTGNKDAARAHSFPAERTSKVRLRIKSFRKNATGDELNPHLKWVSVYNHEASFFDK
jgi:hypothetical protein